MSRAKAWTEMTKRTIDAIWGPVGGFPRGKLSPDDKGELAIAIGVQGDCVAIWFGTEVAWIAMPPDEAITFAQSIIDKAMRLKERTGPTG